MSTAPIDSGGSGGGFNRILSHISSSFPRDNSVGTGENIVIPNNTASNPTLTTNQNTDSTWIDSVNRLDRFLSGSLSHLLYRFIDITLLLIGLLCTPSVCKTSNPLAVTSICLLIFYFLDLMIIFCLVIRNFCSRRSQMTEEQKLEQLRRASTLRGFFIFFKLIPICVGTGYSFSTTVTNPIDCELMRFCLGMVCMSTWLVILIPPTKPELPVRRSLFLEGFVLCFVLIINCTYIGTVATAMRGANHSFCEYDSIDDLYLQAPLKFFASIGIALFACTTSIHVINLVVNRLYFRFNHRASRWFSCYCALQYTLNYFGAIIVIYYFSIGALILFQPRSGQPCRSDAPQLYRVLLIWQWIRILAPLIAVPLIIIFCWLGVCFGVMLSYCLPASITVPLLNSLRMWTTVTPASMNPNPPATQEHIDKLPTALFGQDPDPFNQSECAICQTNFESNEQLKKLPCGHLFHSTCVSHWLLITRICPICRQRMSSPTL